MNITGFIVQIDSNGELRPGRPALGPGLKIGDRAVVVAEPRKDRVVALKKGLLKTWAHASWLKIKLVRNEKLE